MDIGCSNGSFLKYLSYKLPSKTYLGTDTNKNLLNFAKKRIILLNLFTMIL